MLNKSKLINIIFWFLILMFVIFRVYNLSNSENDFGVLFTNFLVVFLSVIFMNIGDKYNYSLNKMFMLFSFFFFGIAPVLQYQNKIVFWNMGEFKKNDYLKMNLIILLILIMYQFFYIIFSKIKLKSISTNKYTSLSLNNYKKRKIGNILLITSFLSFVFILFYFKFSFIALFFRFASYNHIDVPQSISLIISNFIRPIPVISLIAFKIINLKSKKKEVFLLILALLSNFPTSNARFYIGAMYIPILILYLPIIRKKYMLFNNLFTGLFLIFFPILDSFRRSITNNFTLFDFSIFTQAHFDSYQMFMKVFKEDFITYGKQLLTSLLFFVPRSVWPNKSVGSGYLVAHTFGLTYDNISMNYFGEGYVNFGFTGIFLFIIFISYLNARYDKYYWNNIENKDWKSWYYNLFLGLEFFILRGDLLSSTAFSIGFLTSTIIIFHIIKPYLYSKKNDNILSKK